MTTYKITLHNGDIDIIENVKFIEYWIGTETISVDFVVGDNKYGIYAESYNIRVIERIEVLKNDMHN